MPSGETLCHRTPLGAYVLATAAERGYPTITALSQAIPMGYPTLHRVLSAGRGRLGTLERIAEGIGVDVAVLVALV